jgi:hypothetical protein
MNFGIAELDGSRRSDENRTVAGLAKHRTSRRCHRPDKRKSSCADKLGLREQSRNGHLETDFGRQTLKTRPFPRKVSDFRFELESGHFD